MKQERFEIGDLVNHKEGLKKGYNTVYEITEETKDKEGNYEYYIKVYGNDEANEEGPFYPESLVDSKFEPIKSKFPSFKSYGLTKEQVWEVTKLFMRHMVELHKDLAWEAFSDGNYEWTADYFKEAQHFVNILLMEDKIWHRFVEE